MFIKKASLLTEYIENDQLNIKRRDYCTKWLSISNIILLEKNKLSSEIFTNKKKIN